MKSFFAKVIAYILKIFDIILSSKSKETIKIPEKNYDEELIEDNSVDTPEVIEKLPDEDIAHHEIPTTSEDTPEFDEECMFFYFVDEGMTYYGAAGLLGNLFAESGLKSNNLQNSFNKKFNMTDDEYTESVDNETYHEFVSDSAGYGLAQWTYWTRKQNLLNYARERGKSIGNPEMQCSFLMKELKESYKSLFDILRSTQSVREASDAVLFKFERPADMSESVQIKRASYGEEFYEKYKDI